MSAYTYLTVDNIVSGRPCKLLSVIVSNTGSGSGKVILYDEQSAVSGREIAMLFCANDDSKQYRFEGLETQRGLYVDFVEKADAVTVEWEPAGYPGPPPTTT